MEHLTRSASWQPPTHDWRRGRVAPTYRFCVHVEVVMQGSGPAERDLNPLAGALLTDLCQFNMVQAYLDHGETKPAVFEFFVRKLPARRGFLMAAGLDQALEFLERLRFSAQEIEWLARSGRFRPTSWSILPGFRFTGDVQAMREGSIFFVDAYPVEVTATLAELAAAVDRRSRAAGDTVCLSASSS
jgi:hypothetical protein